MPTPRVSQTKVQGSFQEVLVSRTSGPCIFDTPSLSSIRTHIAVAAAIGIDAQDLHSEDSSAYAPFILLRNNSLHFLTEV